MMSFEKWPSSFSAFSWLHLSSSLFFGVLIILTTKERTSESSGLGEDVKTCPHEGCSTPLFLLHSSPSPYFASTLSSLYRSLSWENCCGSHHFSAIRSQLGDKRWRSLKGNLQQKFIYAEFCAIFFSTFLVGILSWLIFPKFL